MEKVIIPASITEIESGAFYFCENLKIIDIHTAKERVKTPFHFKDDKTKVNYIGDNSPKD